MYKSQSYNKLVANLTICLAYAILHVYRKCYYKPIRKKAYGFSWKWFLYSLNLSPSCGKIYKIVTIFSLMPLAWGRKDFLQISLKIDNSTTKDIDIENYLKSRWKTAKRDHLITYATKDIYRQINFIIILEKTYVLNIENNNFNVTIKENI